MILLNLKNSIDVLFRNIDNCTTTESIQFHESKVFKLNNAIEIIDSIV